ncbi:MAG: group II intron reverse transcriptase/maturase [Planctomycetota bacterium]
MLTKKYDRPLRGLSTMIDLEWLLEAHRQTRKGGAVGVDGVSSEAYAADLEGTLEDLLVRMKNRTYKAPVIRRVEIPKPGGGTRPLGITTFEDKVAQRAVKMTLEPMYEQKFYDFSYGFRPGRSAQDALEHVRRAIGDGTRWVLDVDVQKFFDTIDRQTLKELLEKQVNDRGITHLVGKWLRQGVLSDGVVVHAEQGTPQGGVLSPLLANIYLHYVLDEWWSQTVLSHLEGHGELIRYADDFVMVFTHETDARRVLRVLPQRFEKYGLTVHPEKTRLVHLRPLEGGGRSDTFEFLGFTHYLGANRKGGRLRLQRKTASKRLSRSLRNVKDWVQRHKHADTRWQLAELNRKLLGYYAYYGLPDNYRQLSAFREGLTARWRRALTRRSQKAYVPWKWFGRIARQLARPRTRRSRQLQLMNP